MEHRTRYFCSSVPPALIRAAGSRPVFHQCLNRYSGRADRFLGVPFCPFSKVVLDDLLGVDLNQQETWLFASACDATRRLSELIRTALPSQDTLVLEIPFTLNDQAVDVLARRLEKTAEEIGERTGTSLNEILDRLQQDEEHSRLETEHDRSQYLSGRITGLTWINPDCPESSLTKGPALLLMASHLFVPPAVHLLEERGFTVYLDSPLSNRQRVFIPESTTRKADPCQVLAHRYLREKFPCPRRAGSRRTTLIESMVSDLSIQGIVSLTPKFCDSALYELGILRQRVSLPFLVLEHEAQFPGVGQWETRIDAFRETLI